MVAAFFPASIGRVLKPFSRPPPQRQPKPDASSENSTLQPRELSGSGARDPKPSFVFGVTRFDDLLGFAMHPTCEHDRKGACDGRNA